MEIQQPFHPDMINKYRDYFLEIAYSGYIIPETQMRFITAIEFSLGVVLEIYLQANRDPSIFAVSENSDPVPHKSVTSLADALKELELNLDQIFPGEQKKYFFEALRQNHSFLKRTVRLYYAGNDRIYIIKGKDNEIWNRYAAEQDIKKMVEGIRHLSSRHYN